jgi:hypothetical protein
MDPSAFFYLDCTFITLFTTGQTRQIGHRLPKGQLRQQRWGHRTVKVHRSRRVPANKTFHVLQSVRSIYNFTFSSFFFVVAVTFNFPGTGLPSHLALRFRRPPLLRSATQHFDFPGDDRISKINYQSNGFNHSSFDK